MIRSQYILERGELDTLLSALREGGRTLIGPTVKDGAILWGEIASTTDLPAGWSDDQERGRYRLTHRDDPTLFGCTVGPDSLKKYFLPPSLAIFSSARKKGSLDIAGTAPPKGLPPPGLAFIGVRACELSALALLDKVLTQGAFPDPHYAAHRAGAFIVGVNCTRAGQTCFCASMDSGPRCRSGFDISMTEVTGEGRHHFICTAGTKRGEKMLAAVCRREATSAEADAADLLLERVASAMGRTMDTAGIRDLLHQNFEHERWDHAAKRCLSCANCTMVCPTCFCTTVEDSSDLAGTGAGRRRLWDSCFSVDYAYIHGGSLRPSTRSRYRQWLTHKLGAWHDQFGTSGCVGCGRCITWCPVGIDITEEVLGIRTGSQQRPTEH